MNEADDIAWGDNPRGTYEKALERIAELEKAIQQYIACQTTNQWVTHFKKALEEK